MGEHEQFDEILDAADMVFSLDDILPFPGHQGESVRDVIINDVSFITDLLDNTSFFVLDSEAFALYSKYVADEEF